MAIERGWPILDITNPSHKVGRWRCITGAFYGSFLVGSVAGAGRSAPRQQREAIQAGASTGNDVGMALAGVSVKVLTVRTI